MTMSTSCAPASTTHRVSSSLISSGDWPEGNAVATEATFTAVPRVRSRAYGTRFGYTQIAATEGMSASLGSGRMPLELSAATFPGVSAPSSVVRSIMRIARSSANTFDSRLIERFERTSARSSSATASTEPRRGSRGSSGSSKPPGSAGAVVTRLSLGITSRRPDHVDIARLYEGETVVVLDQIELGRRRVQPVALEVIKRRCLVVLAADLVICDIALSRGDRVPSQQRSRNRLGISASVDVRRRSRLRRDHGAARRNGLRSAGVMDPRLAPGEPDSVPIALRLDAVELLAGHGLVAPVVRAVRATGVQVRIVDEWSG